MRINLKGISNPFFVWVFLMPVVEISLVGGELSQEQKIRIGSEICDLLIREIPRLTRESVWVVFNEKTPGDWIIGGKSLKEILQK